MPYILHDLMFIHIPKCGGHSVWNVMRENGGFRTKEVWGGSWTHHMSAVGIRQKLQGKYGSYKKFALVRNPWERAVGLYYGRNKLNKHSPAGFAKFMKQYRGLNKMRWNPHYPQSRMILPDVLTFKLNEIDKLYDWLEDEAEIKITNREEVKTGKNRYAERLPWREYYNDSLREEIRRKHERDIERWGWTWE